jgi:hypothetical protein
MFMFKMWIAGNLALANCSILAVAGSLKLMLVGDANWIIERGSDRIGAGEIKRLNAVRNTGQAKLDSFNWYDPVFKKMPGLYEMRRD